MCSCVLNHFSRVWLFVTPMDCSPPGPSVHEILQAGILEWVAMPSSRGSSWLRDRTHVSCVCCISCIAGGFFTAELPGRLHIYIYSPFFRLFSHVSPSRALMTNKLLYVVPLVVSTPDREELRKCSWYACKEWRLSCLHRELLFLGTDIQDWAQMGGRRSSPRRRFPNWDSSFLNYCADGANHRRAHKAFPNH